MAARFCFVSPRAALSPPFCHAWLSFLPAAALCSQEGSQKFTIAPGECKSFCTCGLSKNFPLCALLNAHRVSPHGCVPAPHQPQYVLPPSQATARTRRTMLRTAPRSSRSRWRWRSTSPRKTSGSAAARTRRTSLFATARTRRSRPCRCKKARSRRRALPARSSAN